MRSALLALGLFLATCCTSATARDVFVAATGSDQNPGTRSRSFATLEAARDAIRQFKQRGALPKGSVTVWIRGGDYVRERGFELTAQDSGTAEAPVVYRAYKDEPVRLLGGRVIAGFKPVSAPEVLSRLSESARGHVLGADLRAQGITNFGQLKSRGFGRATTPAHLELFFNGQPMTLARWPNEGAWEKIAGFPETAGKGDDHGGKIGDLPGGFLYAGDRPRRWKDTSDLWVHGYWAWDWANSYERVESLGLEERLIKTAPPHGLYGFRKGQRFYFLNVLEELDQPGEWFLDRVSWKLYFWPPVGAGFTLTPALSLRERGKGSQRVGESERPRSSQAPPAVLPLPQGEGRGEGERNKKPSASTTARDSREVEVLVSTLEQPLLSLTDVSHVTFRGLTLEATRGNAVVIKDGESNRIAGCAIRNIGNYGVTIEGGRGHGVIGCDILDTGDGGVSLSGGDRQTLTPGGHFVENCHFQRQGRWSKCYVPAVLMSGVGQRVSHCLIHDHPHCAILFTGNDHLIEFNDIHHIALETGDVGAIYTGRDWTFRRNRIRHNFIHETGGVGMGSMGVYMDDCVSGTEVFGNVFYKVHWAMFLGGGRDHRVENNLFVECDPAVRMDGRGLDKSPVWRGMVDDIRRRQLAAGPLSLYRERYPAMKTLDRYYGPPGGPVIEGAAFTGVPPEGNVVARNVCVGKWLEAGWHAKNEWLELRENYVGPDPGIADIAKRDFRIHRESPVWKLGFEPIPVGLIGLREDEFRRELTKGAARKPKRRQ
ncbi:MAG: right-handed parallel beta-helix repeat-containing protein [Verrucomicrobia bacterium]|nr:right-handed parallel beta-helix repeat-containing protein [Verrucomicrobiota bacterium]